MIKWNLNLKGKINLGVKLKGARVLFLCSTDNMIWQFLVSHVKDLEDYGAHVDCVCSKTGFWFNQLAENYKLNMIDIPMCRIPWKIKNFKSYYIPITSFKSALSV